MAGLDEDAKNMIWTAVHTTPAVDIRVFAKPGSLALPGVSGIDALLTTPQILAEFFRRRGFGRGNSPDEQAADAAHRAYAQSLTRRELADIVWRLLFVDNAPLSEPCRIVLTSMGLLGLDVASGDLHRLRDRYDAVPEDERWRNILAAANLNAVLFPVESMRIDECPAAAARLNLFRPVLYLTDLLADWKESARRLRVQGFGLKARVDEYTPLELRRHLAAEIAKIQPALLALEWPEGADARDGQTGRLVREAALPACREKGIPFFLLSEQARMDELEPLWKENREVHFLLSPGREDQFPAAILAAAANRNLLLCGADQPLSYPLSSGPYLARGLEVLGSGFHACHSGAEAAEELAGCWAHLRWTLGKTLIRHCADLWRTGWRYGEAEIRREVRALLGGNVRAFLKL